MGITFQTVDSYEAIHGLLLQFSGSFHSLQDGSCDAAQLAEKLCRFGTVLTLSKASGIAAFAGFYCNDTESRCAYLSMLAVDPAKTHQGLGQKILKAAMIHSQDAGMLRMRLQVRRDNAAAIRLYEKTGFQKLSTQTQDSYFMERPLGDLSGDVIL